MSSRGFNRGRFYGRNSWRRNYRSRRASRGRGTDSNPPPTPSTEPENEDTLDESDIADIERRISVNTASFQPKKGVPSPYAGWRLYFYDDDYKTSPDIVRKVKATEEFIITHGDLFNEEVIEESGACLFDLKVFLSDEEFLYKWPTFSDDLYHEPAQTLNCLGLAIHQIMWQWVREQTNVAVKQIIPLIKARISNYTTTTALKNLKTPMFGKLVSINGTVIRVGNVKLQCSWLAFECAGCGLTQCVRQQDGNFTQPKSCMSKECHFRTFKPMRSSEFTQTYDWQKLRIQEEVLDDRLSFDVAEFELQVEHTLIGNFIELLIISDVQFQYEAGRVPRTVECEVSDDLVSSCSPGDEVTIVGIVKISSANNKKFKGPCTYSLYIEAVSLFNNKNRDCADGSIKDDGMKFEVTQKDIDAIQQIYLQENPFKLLVQSLCPTIFGHEVIKAGLLLALFGGSEIEAAEHRAQSHVLVVGDPGMGKSQMLQACSFVAPRGVFVCGNTTTSSGLTVTLTREGSGDFALEGGALVLADHGCCCIDEFDKMTNQHQSLLEAMEQQTISIAKAGVICQMPARTTVLAAANPAGGHYNKAKTVAENLRMGQPLLSRFDLVFILLDQPNEQFDSLLSEHVMRIHSGKSAQKKESSVELDTSMHSLKTADIKLSERLQLKPWDNLELIPPSLIRKYIAYARKYVPPVRLSDEAKNALQEFYLYLRQNHHTKDSTPVTTRQLKSLVRLTQARAKVELREEATLQDATDVIDLMRWSLVDTFTDELGTLDFRRSQHGSGISSKNQTKRFLAALHQKCESLAKSIFSVNEMKEIAKLVKVDVTNFSSLISNLNIQGFLLKKGRDSYQVLSAD